ncbi:MAG: PstS family phosphate ABC transporter substrate-binding protein [Phycisphaerae bacterium]|nr:PstS family phosphate ABC transporter substrate-binding protein [Phycisphaerae bacterium]
MGMRQVFAAVVAAASMMAASQAQTTVDPKLPDYSAAQGVSGKLKSIGSDTMNNVMAHWAEGFKKLYPGVDIEIEGKGSSTAPPALIEGQSQFGPMSREMKKEEMDKFEAKFGFKPTGLRAGIDCLAVYVHKDCPLTEITFEQIQKVFSVTGPDMTWDQLGVADAAYKGKPVSLYGRNSASGTYGYFKEHALGKKDFKATVKEQPGSSAVVQGVATDKFGMGYSGIGYKTADVKALKVAQKGKAIEANVENAYNGSYPLGRYLYVYVNYDKSKGLDPLRAEFVKMMFSRPGQEGVVKDGYIPVTADIAREDLKKVGLEAKF